MVINLIAVDDELDAKILFEHFFRNEVEEGSVILRFVQSGRACMKLLLEEERANSLVVTDINMPDMSGIELAEKINQECPDVKVFLISAYEAGSQRDRIKHLNVSEYIAKPVDFDELKQKVFQQFSEA
ncbi:MAG: response regulator [Bacteriovoracaceae bacterium]